MRSVTTLCDMHVLVSLQILPKKPPYTVAGAGACGGMYTANTMSASLEGKSESNTMILSFNCVIQFWV